MKKTVKLGLSLGLLSLLTVGLFGCASKDKEGGKDKEAGKEETKELAVSIWNYDTIPEFKALFEAFEKEHPGVKIKPVDIPANDYETKLTTMLSSGDKTDVLTMKNISTYSNYALRDQLLDITEHVKKVDQGPAKSSYEVYNINGKNYAQPFRNDFWVLYYNKKLFDDAGVPYPDNLTWEEYSELAKKLSQPDKQIYGTYEHTWPSTVSAPAASQNDKNLLEPSYDYMIPYYERVVDLQKEKAQMDFGTAKSTKVTYQSQFEGSKAAMMYMGTWYMGGLLTNIDAGKTDVEWGISQLPQLEKGKDIVTFGAPTAFAINKNAKNKDLAQEFLDFAAGEKGAEVMVNVGVVPSYRTEEINKKYLARKGMPNDEIAQKAFNPDKIVPDFPVDKQGPAVQKILQEEHDLIMTGDKTPAEGVKEMEKRVEKELNQ